MGKPMMPFRSDVGHLAASLDGPLLRVDDRGVVVWRNERFKTLAEGRGPTMLGRFLRELVHPPDRGLVDAALIGLDGGASLAGIHVTIRAADGSPTPSELKLLRTPSFEEHDAFVTVLLRVAGG